MDDSVSRFMLLCGSSCIRICTQFLVTDRVASIGAERRISCRTPGRALLFGAGCFGEEGDSMIEGRSGAPPL